MMRKTLVLLALLLGAASAMGDDVAVSRECWNPSKSGVPSPVFHCTFDEKVCVEHPAIGFGSKFVGGEFELFGRIGQALKIPAGQPGAMFPLPPGTIGPCGTIDFWARVDDFGPLLDRGCPRFFDIKTEDAPKAEISHDWNGNNGSGGRGLTFRVNGLPPMSSSSMGSRASILANPPQGWHRYTLVWDAAGVKGLPPEFPAASAAFFFDGRCACVAPYDPNWRGPALADRKTVLSFPTPPDEAAHYSRRGFSIDEFRIWHGQVLPDPEPYSAYVSLLAPKPAPVKAEPPPAPKPEIKSATTVSESVPLKVEVCTTPVSKPAFTPPVLSSVPVSARLTLADGSVLKGTLQIQSYDCIPSFEPRSRITIPAMFVKSVTFLDNAGKARLDFLNGDALTVTIASPALKFKSIIGLSDVPRSVIKTIEMERVTLPPAAKEEIKNNNAAKAAARGDGLVFHCTFDDAEAVKTPAVGPVGKPGNGTFVEGKVGKACRVPKGGSAGSFAFPAGMFGEEGCIEFWAKLETNKEKYGDCDPRIIFLDSPAGWFTVEFSGNNGGGLGGFCVRCFDYSYIAGGRFGNYYSYADTLGPDVNGWHHYAFSWTKDALTTYIDGKPLKNMRKYAGNVLNGERMRSAASSMGIPNDGVRHSVMEPRTPFVIDEMKIWDFAKTEFDL